MRAVVTTPDAPGRLIVVDAPAPAASPGMAVVRVRASSINRGETRLVPARPNGWAPGQDLAGVVEIPAPDGGPARGSRVVGLADGGAWSELVAVPVERLALLPENVTFEQAACLGVAGLTPLRALRALGDVVGRELLVTGVSGGTGNIAAQLALAGGATVTGLARGTFALEGVRVVTALDDRLYDRVIDTVGGDALNAAMAHVRPHAKVTFFSGPAPVTFARGPVTVEAIYVYQSPGRFDEDLRDLAGLVARGRLTPLIDRVVPIDAVNDGLAALNAGGIRGKIVLVRNG
ncbi:MAG: zinc-binding dehydrogenase [Candidatus Lustribacter sp.]|jgi:NADPH:quinone reductase-like Zn-dependent oxidoreductase